MPVDVHEESPGERVSLGGISIIMEGIKKENMARKTQKTKPCYRKKPPPFRHLSEIALYRR